MPKLTPCPRPDCTAIVLPTVDEVADVLRSGDGLRFYSDTARAVLGLIAVVSVTALLSAGLAYALGGLLLVGSLAMPAITDGAES